MKQNRKNIIIGLSALFVGQIILLLFLNLFSSQSIKSRSFGKKLIKGLTAKST